LVRLQGYLAWMRSAEDKMRMGIEKGYVLPKSLIVKVLPQLEAMAQTAVADHLFYSPVKQLPEEFTSEEKEGFKTAYLYMLENQIIPAYKHLHDFMASEYLEAGR
jgi:uncharacterized protein (DUF885 family)